MTRPARPKIGLVLDESAVVAYCNGSVDVGETIREVAIEGAAVALPVLCLAEATQHTTDRDCLDVLVHHDATTVVGVANTDWRILAYLVDLTKEQFGTEGQFGYGMASALAVAVDNDCDVLSRHSDRYDRIDVGPLGIPIGD